MTLSRRRYATSSDHRRRHANPSDAQAALLAVLPLTTLFIYERSKMENPAKLHLPRGGFVGGKSRDCCNMCVREAPKKETLTLSRDTSIFGSEVARSVWYCWIGELSKDFSPVPMLLLPYFAMNHPKQHRNGTKKSSSMKRNERSRRTTRTHGRTADGRTDGCGRHSFPPIYFALSLSLSIQAHPRMGCLTANHTWTYSHHPD